MNFKILQLTSNQNNTHYLALTLFCTLSLLLPGESFSQDHKLLKNLVFDRNVLMSEQIETPNLNTLSNSKRQELTSSINNYQSIISSQASYNELLQAYGLLAITYQQLDQHGQAISILENAISETIKKNGIDNLEQIPFQEQLIPSLITLNNNARIDDIEKLIYSLNVQNNDAGSIEMYAATINFTDWIMAAYYRESFGTDGQSLKAQRNVIAKVTRTIGHTEPADREGIAQEINSDTGIGSGSNMMSAIFNGTIKDVSNHDINAARLRSIDNLLADFQEAHYASSNPQLAIVLDISQRIARLAFATKQEMDFERENYTYVPNYDGSREQALRNDPRRMEESFESGRNALKAIINALKSATGIKNEALATALIDLGDWNLAYGQTQDAKNAYVEARQTLFDAGYSSETIDQALATNFPPQIPTFATHLYTRASTGISQGTPLEYKGYIDLSYSIDELGNASTPIFQNSSEETATIERLIATQLKSMKFRPTLKAGELVSPGHVSTRYYFSY